MSAESLAELFFMLLTAGLLWLWFDSLGAREVALASAAEACAEEGWQLLDQTVAACSLRFCRDETGRLCLARRYGFEFSDTGDNRRRGEVHLVGRTVHQVQLGPRLTLIPGGVLMSKDDPPHEPS